jgi:uncharacterized repeat protein (TIGR03943 family)
MTKQAQNLLMVLIGIALLWVTLATDEYLNYVKPWFRLMLIPAAAAILLLGSVGFLRERQTASTPNAHADRPVDSGANDTALSHSANNNRPDAPADTSHDGDTNDDSGARHAHADGGGPRVAWLLILPVATIFIISPSALGAFTAARDTGRSAPPPPPPAQGFSPLPATGEPTAMSMGEFVSRASEAQAGNGDSFRGRPVGLTGFVTPRKEGGWYLTRLVLNCCAGDAVPIQVIVHDQQRPPTETWVRVIGTWTPSSDPKGVTYELRARQVQRVKEPKNAYDGDAPANFS